jgi:hypothetical protein
MLPLLIGAGVGLLKSEGDRARDAQNQKVQSAIARYSPWTGMHADTSHLHTADPLGSMMQGGMAGAMIGQGMGGGEEAAAEGGSAGSVGSTGVDNGFAQLPSEGPMPAAMPQSNMGIMPQQSPWPAFGPQPYGR